MNLIKYLLSILFIAFFVCNSYAQAPRTTELQITWPVNRSVFQRPSSGQALVSLAAQTTYYPDNKLQFRIRRLNPQNEDIQGYVYGSGINWLDYDDAGGEITSNIGGQYKGVIRNVSLSDGWYLLETKTKKNVFGGNRERTSIVFGVGDVYLIAGQSNASGFKSNDGDPNLVNIFENLGTMPKAVSVINRNSDGTENDGSRAKLIPFRNGFNSFTKESVVFPKGVSSWLWAPLAYKMLNNSGAPNVPVMFLNVANPDQSIQAWNTGSQNYQRLRHFSQTFCNIYGTRSILWMQGERDVKEHFEFDNTTWPGDERSTIPLSSYNTKLESIINQYNSDMGTGNNAQWSIAKVSRSNYRQSGFSDQCDIYKPTPNINFGNIKGEQQEAINNTNSRNGADIDNVGVTDRGPCQEIHLSNQGLENAANEWFGNQPWTSTPNSSKVILKMTVTQSGGNYVLTVPTSQNNLNLVTFRWVRSNFNDAGGIYTGQLASNIISGSTTSNSITVSPNSTDLEYYVCYASPNNDADDEVNGLNSNWYVSQPFLTKTTIPTQFISPSSPISLGQPINSENSFQVTASNLDWEASESTSWFEIITEDDLSGGAGVSNFKVRATETNNTTSNRSADIAFLLSDGTNKYVTITQSATTGCTQASLSTLNPTNPSGEWQGYGTRQLNKSIDGNTLMVGGYTTGNGIGTHANSTIVYNLSGQYGTFSGSVGRDDEADNCGCGTMKLQFIIKADGATLFTSSLLGTTDARQAFSVDVTGKNTLELIVNDGGDNFWGDHADWLDPVLYCGAAPSCTTAPSAPTNVSSVAGSGGSFTLSATCAAGTVTWSTGAVGNSISVSPTVSTNYSVSCVSGSCPPSNTVSIGVTVNSGACSAISDGLVMGTWNATGQQLVARFFNGQFWLTQRTGSNPDGFVVRGSGMLQRSDVSLANGSYYNLVGCFSWTYSNYDNLGNPPSSVFSTPANYSLGYAEDGTMFYTATTGGGGGGSCIDAYVTNAWASATIGYGSTPQIGYRFDGGAMVMGSTTYTQGIGTHAGSEIIYNFTNNPYANFKASVGRDVDANGCNCPAGSGQTIL